MNTLIFALAFLGFLPSLMLFFSKEGHFYKYAKLFFALFILIQSLNILYAYSLLTAKYVDFPAIIQTNHLLQLLTPVIIYLFTYYLIYPSASAKKQFIIYFLPFFIMTFYLLPFFLKEENSKILFIQSFLKGQMTLEQRLIHFVKFITGIYFLTASINLLNKNEIRVLNFFSNSENKVHRWLRIALLLFLIIWVLALFSRLALNPVQAIQILAIAVGLMNFYLLFNFVANIYPLTPQQAEEQMLFLETAKKIEIQKNFVKERDINTEEEKTNVKGSQNKEIHISEELLALFWEKIESKKPYLQKDCNLDCFSNKMGIKAYLITEMINKKLGSNFFDFIGQLRAKKAADLLRNPDFNHLTVEAIAEESGFKSKATFYKAFKKQYNTTPSKFKKTPST